MGVFQVSTGLPGIGAEKLAKQRQVSADGFLEYLPGGKQIDSANTRDPDNDDPTRLRPGLLLGKITSSGLYANSVIGVTAGALTTTGTSLTVAAAEAAELVRRIGASGTFNLIGPPTAGGTVATTTVTYSAVNTTTGVITITATGVAYVAGSFVAPADGSQVPLWFLADGWDYPLPNDLVSPLPVGRVPIRGNINGAQLLPWPADTSLQQWVRNGLNTDGQYVFTEKF